MKIAKDTLVDGAKDKVIDMSKDAFNFITNNKLEYEVKEGTVAEKVFLRQ